MPRQNLIAVALAASLALAPFVAVPGPAAATQMAAQTSEFGGVKITVEPVGLAAGTPSLDFEITLETHTRSLDDDLVRTATLIADGRPCRVLGWDGSRPGGHHRKGVLRFRGVSPPPRMLELRIQRPDETRPRVFRWRTGP
jgi:hypothetical protein